MFKRIRPRTRQLLNANLFSGFSKKVSTFNKQRAVFLTKNGKQQQKLYEQGLLVKYNPIHVNTWSLLNIKLYNKLYWYSVYNVTTCCVYTRKNNINIELHLSSLWFLMLYKIYIKSQPCQTLASTSSNTINIMWPFP